MKEQKFETLLWVWRKAGEWFILFSVILGCGLKCLVPTPSSNVSSSFARVNGNFKLGDQERNLVYWTQVSDIHINNLDKSFENYMKQFISELAMINPAFTLSTGDLVNRDDWTTAENEWKTYKDILVNASLWGTSSWIDLLGNHDVKEVLRKGDGNDFHEIYGSWKQGRTKEVVNQFDYALAETNLRFIVLNVAPYPGLALTFIGNLEAIDALKIKEKLQNSENYAHSFIVSHYGFSYIATRNRIPVVNQIGDDGENYTAVLSGHRHQPNLFSRNGKGHLELELGSLGYQQQTRILAVDNGVFSFTDRCLGNWPIVLITNPKDARFLTETDPLSIIQSSTHIRALIWHNQTILSVSALIDGNIVCSTMKRSSLNSSFYTCSWDSSLYSSGFHSIYLVIVDATNTSIASDSHQFSLDGKTIAMTGRLAMESSLNTMQWLVAIFVVSICISLGYMLTLPYLFQLLFSLAFSLETIGTINMLLDGKESAFDYFISKGFTWKKRLIIFFWPVFGSMQMLFFLPNWYLICATIFGYLPLIVPLVYGKLSYHGFCTVWTWGWVYCPEGTSVLDMFALLEGILYYSMIFPTCLLAATRLYEKIRLKQGTRLKIGEILPLVTSIVATIVVWFFIFYTIPKSTSILAPLIWCGILFWGITIFFFIKETKSLNSQMKNSISDPSSTI